MTFDVLQITLMLRLVVAMLVLSAIAAAFPPSYWSPAARDTPLTVSEMGFGVPKNITENTSNSAWR